MVWLSKSFNWRDALVIVKPETLVRWHREGFRRYWKFKSRPGRPSLPRDLQILIRRMAWENPTWGEERIAHELLLKLGLRVSPRSVRKYMPEQTGDGPREGRSDQRWATFDRDRKFSSQLDQSIEHLGLRILKTPVRAPKANALCERAIGTIRRECLAYLIPFNERHLRRILAEWVRHFNTARPHGVTFTRAVATGVARSGLQA